MGITIDNLINLQGTPVAGQRVVKVAPGVWLPVGLGGSNTPGSSSDSSSIQNFSPRAGVIVIENGVPKVQPLAFDGIVPSDSGDAQSSSLLIFDTGHAEPQYGGSTPVPPSAAMDFYKCTYVSSDSSMTWRGRKAVLNNGIYSFQSDSTEGLTYSTVKPELNNIYSDDVLIAADLYTGIPIEGLQLYIPFDFGIYTKTGQTLTQTGTPDGYSTFKGVPSTSFSGNCQFYVVPWENWLTNKDSFTIFIWATYSQPSTKTSRALDALYGTSTELSVFCWGNSSANVFFGSVSTESNTYTADTWWWGCITHDKSTSAVQIKTSNTADVSGTVTLTAQDNKLYIAGSGNQASITRHYGRLAALRIYNRVLSQSQITALANEFTPTA